MQALVPLLQRRFFGAIRRTLFTPWPAHQLHPNFRYCDQSIDKSFDESSETNHDGDENEELNNLCGRIERLPRGESVGSAFQSWMGDGFPILRGDIFHTVNRLRRRQLNKRALEVMEWVIRERPYMPNQLDYSYLLEFTTKLHGVSQGEKLFSRVPSDFQKELLYNNLVIACLDKGMIGLSLAYMKKMRELDYPISFLVYNRLIILHSSPGRKKSIPKILTQMKADKVALHVSTFNILLKMEANQHNIEGLLKVFGDMKQANVEPNVISYCILATAHGVARLYTACEAYVEAIEKCMTGTNWATLDILVILYGYLGKRKELEKTWNTLHEQHHVKSKSYVLAVEAFGKIGQLNRAEELWLEMKTKGLKLTEQFNSMISVYCRQGLITKATALYKEMEKHNCKANAITFRHLALGCLKAGLVKEAQKTLELGMDPTVSTSVLWRSTPWLETTLSMAEIFAEKGDVENTEKLFEELKKANYTKYTFVYNTLIKAYVKAKIYDPHFLRRMILGGARPDSETYSLLKLLEEFRA